MMIAAVWRDAQYALRVLPRQRRASLVARPA
jgi:hypothetical protein